MYETRLAFALPKFLTPPQGLRELAAGIVGSVVRGTTVEVPGLGVFNLGDPNDVARLRAMVAAGGKGIKFRVATPQPGQTPFDFVHAATSPAGIGTLLAVGLGVLFLASRRGR